MERRTAIIICTIIVIGLALGLGLGLGLKKSVANLAYYSLMSSSNITPTANADGSFNLVLQIANITANTRYEIQQKDLNMYGLINTNQFFTDWVAGINTYGPNFNVDTIVKSYNGYTNDQLENIRLMKGEGINGMIPGVIMTRTGNNTTLIYRVAVQDITRTNTSITLTLLPHKAPPKESRKSHNHMADELHSHHFLAENASYADLSTATLQVPYFEFYFAVW